MEPFMSSAEWVRTDFDKGTSTSAMPLAERPQCTSLRQCRKDRLIALNTILCKKGIHDIKWVRSPTSINSYDNETDWLWRHHRRVCCVWQESSMRWPHQTQDIVQRWRQSLSAPVAAVWFVLLSYDSVWDCLQTRALLASETNDRICV